ncbi:MAG: MoaD/ThiS family protein [Desulfobacteraceae bacterium]|nr:MoaD/ThiS family protein [Desulfobacteraceae bacterium]
MIDIGNRTVNWHEGMTLGDLLKDLPEGKDCAVIRLNGRLVSRPNFDKTRVPDQAEIVLIPMIAGG